MTVLLSSFLTFLFIRQTLRYNTRKIKQVSEHVFQQGFEQWIDTPEVHLRPCRRFIMKFFSRNSNWFLAVNLFCKKTPTQMFDMVLNTRPVTQLINLVGLSISIKLKATQKTLITFLLYISKDLVKAMKTFPADIFLLKVNDKNTRTRCKICSKLTIKTPEREWRFFIVNFGHISHLILVSVLLTLNM